MNKFDCPHCGKEIVVTSDEPKKVVENKEPIATLYCVKDHGTDVFKTGKTYRLYNDRPMESDCGIFSVIHESLESFFGMHPQLKSSVVPLVKRPAKVGEWILPCKAWFDIRGIKNTSQIYVVENIDGSGDIWFDNDSRCAGLRFEDHKNEYSVLDGYKSADDLSNYEWVDGYKGFDSDLACQPANVRVIYEIGKEYDLGEEEQMCNKGFHFCKTLEETHQFYSDNGKNRFCKVQGLVKKGATYSDKYCARKIKVTEEVTKPKYYNGKVICTGVPFLCNLTPGRVYKFTDGCLKDDFGIILPMGAEVNPRKTPFASFEDLQNYSMATWLEYEGEQS